jgi:FemAB-related protein (PEP-CTERM system-associated)
LARCDTWRAALADELGDNPALDPRWLRVLAAALRCDPYCLELSGADNRPQAILPLAHVRSLLFGRHLVGLPYVSTGGIVATHTCDAQTLANAAVALADELRVRQLQLRHETRLPHPALASEITAKTHLRLPLPPSAGGLWDQLSPKVRNQVRKGQKQSLVVAWGREELLADFYAVFSQNMRDLGTPVYGRELFDAMLREFDNHCEICVVRAGQAPVAGGILIHGRGMTQVPSASSLKAFNPTCANMLLYWELLARSIDRAQRIFDFGRSTAGSGTYRFKQQWGAAPVPAIWQVYLRQGRATELRPECGSFQLASRVWRKLPLAMTRWLGPHIVRGLP